MLKSAQQQYEQARPFEKTIRQFGEVLKDDQGMYTKLAETPDKESFIDLYVRLAGEHGYQISRDDLMVVVQEQKMGSDWLIPKKVLMLVRDRF